MTSLVVTANRAHTSEHDVIDGDGTEHTDQNMTSPTVN